MCVCCCVLISSVNQRIWLRDVKLHIDTTPPQQHSNTHFHCLSQLNEQLVCDTLKCHHKDVCMYFCGNLSQVIKYYVKASTFSASSSSSSPYHLCSFIGDIQNVCGFRRWSFSRDTTINVRYVLFYFFTTNSMEYRYYIWNVSKAKEQMRQKWRRQKKFSQRRIKGTKTNRYVYTHTNSSKTVKWSVVRCKCR